MIRKATNDEGWSPEASFKWNFSLEPRNERNEFADCRCISALYANISNCIRDAVSYDGGIEYS